MSAPKTLRLVSNEPISDCGRLLVLTSEIDIGFVGGQFLIVCTGLKKADGAPLKRCYSILSKDSDQRCIEIAIYDVGRGSHALQALEPGAKIIYSGPFGKLKPNAQPTLDPNWIFATDTGITAAVGLVNAASFEERLPRTTLVWCEHSSPRPFPLSEIKGRLPRKLQHFECVELPAVGHSARCDAALEQFQLMTSAASSAPGAIWLTGDGSVLFALRDAIEDQFGSELASNAGLECFFNNPNRLKA